MGVSKNAIDKAKKNTSKIFLIGYLLSREIIYKKFGGELQQARCRSKFV